MTHRVFCVNVPLIMLGQQVAALCVAEET